MTPATEQAPRFDLVNEPVTCTQAWVLGALYDLHAPLLDGIVEREKLAELFEDIPYIDQFGYLRYDDFYTEDAESKILGYDDRERNAIVKKLESFFVALSSIACKNATTPPTLEPALHPATGCSLHSDVGGGHAFLSNFFGSKERGKFWSRIANTRYADRPQTL